MKSMRKLLAMLLVLAIILSLAACGSTETSDIDATNSGSTPSASVEDHGIISAEDIAAQTTTEEPEGIVSGTEITYHLSNTIGVPTGTGGNTEGDYFVQYNVYDGLVKANGSDLTDPQPAVAESYEISEDGTVITFKIREGITFSNGDSLDAHDVVYTFDLQAEYTPMNTAGFVSWEATDDYTFVLTLEEPQATIINQLGSFLWGIRDKELCESVGDPTAQETWIGCGPYYIDSFTRDAEIILKANPNYWDTEHLAHIETVKCEIVPDSSTAVIAMQTGELDVLSGFSYLQAQQLAADESVYVASYYTPATYTIYMNTTRAPFDDLAVRQALNYIIDKEEVNYAAFDGMADEINICWYNESPDYVPDSELPIIYEHDVDKGLQMLTDAGYDPSDISFTLLHSTTIDANTLVAENIQAQLLALGMNVELNSVNESNLQSTVIADDYDCVLYTGGSNRYNNIQIAWNMFTVEGRVNLPQYTLDDELGATMTELITNAKYSASMEESYELSKQATCLAVENALYIPLCARPIYIAVNNSIQGMENALGSNAAECFLQHLWVVE